MSPNYVFRGSYKIFGTVWLETFYTFNSLKLRIWDNTHFRSLSGRININVLKFHDDKRNLIWLMIDLISNFCCFDWICLFALLTVWCSSEQPKHNTKPALALGNSNYKNDRIITSWDSQSGCGHRDFFWHFSIQNSIDNRQDFYFIIEVQVCLELGPFVCPSSQYWCWSIKVLHNNTETNHYRKLPT